MSDDDGVIIHVPAEVKAQKGFLRRVTAATALGEGLDGYDLGIISVVLPAIAHELDLGVVMIGLIGASTLIGIFFGSPIFGWLTDRYGRRTLFTIDIISFVILGLLQLFVTAGWQLLVLRLLLGVAIGAEYAIGAQGSGLGPYEGATVRVDPGGTVYVFIGVAAQGQGHATTLAQISGVRRAPYSFDARCLTRADVRSARRGRSRAGPPDGRAVRSARGRSRRTGSRPRARSGRTRSAWRGRRRPPD